MNRCAELAGVFLLTGMLFCGCATFGPSPSGVPLQTLPASGVDLAKEPPQSAEPIPAPQPLAARAPAAAATDVPSAVLPLRLEEVIHSVHEHYPALREVVARRAIAAGEMLAASSPYDLRLEAESVSQPIGFYENYHHSIALKQNLIHGGSVFAGYRLGRGEFEPWYQELVTDEGGEFKAGFVAPLAQGRAIDKYRAGLWTAELARATVEPAIRRELLLFVQQASIAYWNWVAAGELRRVAEELLQIANRRNEWLQEQVAAGDLPRIDLVDNQRLILAREVKLVEAEQKLQEAAIKLSLFWRSPQGQPVVPPLDALPRGFPSPEALEPTVDSAEIQYALDCRPELHELRLFRNQADVELALARNQMLPGLDVSVASSQDVGEPASPKKDKSPLVMEAAIDFEVPLQRRAALGKLRATQGKVAQIGAKQQWATDKIRAEIAAAKVAVAAAYERYERARKGLELTRQMELAEQDAFAAGQSNLLMVNLREQQTADAAAVVAVTLQDYFAALALYRTALGEIDPTQV